MTSDPGFTTPEMSQVFSREARVARFLRFESELIAAQAELGSAPVEAADEIDRACRELQPDAQTVLVEGWEVGTPLVPLLDELRSRLGPETARWLHQGATTQDVVDTAQVLQMKSGLAVLDTDLAAVAATLARLADQHRGTVMMGRTFLQSAVPTTFGSKAALWLEPLVRHRRGLLEVTARLPLQLGGPVGDLASFGEGGFQLADRLAARLGLEAPVAPWHTDRAPITETVALIGRVASSMAKIATDVALLAQSGIEEIRARSGGSSSMPGKRNPIDAVRARAAAEVCLVMAGGVTGSPAHERERSIGAWQAEWFLVPLIFQTADAAVQAIARCVETIEVDVDRMARNVDADEAGTDVVAADRLIDRVLEAHRQE